MSRDGAPGSAVPPVRSPREWVPKVPINGFRSWQCLPLRLRLFRVRKCRLLENQCPGKLAWYRLHAPGRQRAVELFEGVRIMLLAPTEVRPLTPPAAITDCCVRRRARLASGIVFQAGSYVGLSYRSAYFRASLTLAIDDWVLVACSAGVESFIYVETRNLQQKFSSFLISEPQPVQANLVSCRN